MVRQYLQGTLDFACGIYAVINALALTHGLNLTGARRIFADTVDALSRDDGLRRAFLYNETDHYWLIRQCLAKYCQSGPFRLEMMQPFGSCLLPPGAGKSDEAGVADMFVEEEKHMSGRCENSEEVWRALETWLSPEALCRKKRAAILRFHRFLPDVAEPVVSHWTTGAQVAGDVLYLHDASSEKNSIHKIGKAELLGRGGGGTPLYIVPGSIIFLQRPR